MIYSSVFLRCLVFISFSLAFFNSPLAFPYQSNKDTTLFYISGWSPTVKVFIKCHLCFVLVLSDLFVDNIPMNNLLNVSLILFHLVWMTKRMQQMFRRCFYFLCIAEGQGTTSVHDIRTDSLLFQCTLSGCEIWDHVGNNTNCKMSNEELNPVWTGRVTAILISERLPSVFRSSKPHLFADSPFVTDEINIATYERVSCLFGATTFDSLMCNLETWEGHFTAIMF